jgi:hypothetical protein
MSLIYAIKKKAKDTLNQVRLLLNQFGILEIGRIVLESQKTANFEETELNERAFRLQKVSTFVGINPSL